MGTIVGNMYFDFSDLMMKRVRLRHNIREDHPDAHDRWQVIGAAISDTWHLLLRSMPQSYDPPQEAVKLLAVRLVDWRVEVL